MDQTNPLSGQSVTTNNADFCGRVPLNQTNLVQPHGVLLVVERPSFRILQCSENAGEFFGIEAAALVDQSLPQVFSGAQFERLQLRLDAGIEGKFPLLATLNGRECLFVVDAAPDHLLLEAERLADSQDSFVDVYEQLKYVMAAIEQTTSVEAAAALVARELKSFSGFDKVMVYRFDRDWNGEVIAEEMEEGMESYLHQFFPASDIPKQARELYRKNPYRIIPNIDYAPIRLYPVLNPATHAFTDLSNSNLRSVAGVHLEYLRNMGVQASMSTRILKEGELWGLIACHHRTARYLSYQQCSVFELLSTFITSKIGSVENARQEAERSEGLLRLSRVMDNVYDAGGIAGGIGRQHELLLDLLRADGAVLSTGKSFHAWGSTPPIPALGDLVYWLQSNNVSTYVQYPSLAQVFEPASEYAGQASGLLVLPLQPDRGHYLLAFRREALRRINWSGDPNNAVRFEDDGRRYHPRNSFKVWQQQVEQTAPEWSPVEIQVAGNLAQFLIEFLVRTITT